MNILKGHHKAYTEQAIKETLDYISLNDLPEFPSAALVFAPLRSVLNVCHWHTAPSVNDATAEPAPAKRGYGLPPFQHHPKQPGVKIPPTSYPG